MKNQGILIFIIGYIAVCQTEPNELVLFACRFFEGMFDDCPKYSVIEKISGDGRPATISTTDRITDIPTADGTTDIPTTDGTTEIPTADGTTDIPTADGTTDIPTTDGTTEIPTTDGTSEISTTDGTTDIPTTDGTTEITTTDGTTDITITDGTTDITTADVTTDGTTSIGPCTFYEEFQSGSPKKLQKIHHALGKDSAECESRCDLDVRCGGWWFTGSFCQLWKVPMTEVQRGKYYTVDDCKEFCKANPKCVTVQIRTAGGYCYLYDSKLTEFYESQNNYTIIYKNIPCV